MIERNGSADGKSARIGHLLFRVTVKILFPKRPPRGVGFSAGNSTTEEEAPKKNAVRVASNRSHTFSHTHEKVDCISTETVRSHHLVGTIAVTTAHHPWRGQPISITGERHRERGRKRRSDREGKRRFHRISSFPNTEKATKTRPRQQIETRRYRPKHSSAQHNNRTRSRSREIRSQSE